MICRVLPADREGTQGKDMKIVVLCGGTSTERDVSIVSGENVCRALRAKGHNAILLDVFFGEEDTDLMDAFPEEYDVAEAAERIRSFNRDLQAAKDNPRRSFFGPHVTTLCKMADLVFMALHGANGEDGRVQAVLDLMKIKYTGSGYVSSACAMNKHMAKEMLRAASVPVPMGVVKRKGDNRSYTPLKLPVVVKVACGGSSIGVYIANTDEEYYKALDDAFALEDTVLVEEYIKGREFSVSVIDGESLPVIEIKPKQGFYDYENKYTPGATDEICPAELESDKTAEMRSYAEAGYRALGLEAYGRLDFLMDEDGKIVCLEANTLPGMTPTSLMPQEAAAIGVGYEELCEELIRVSLKKYE